MHPPSPHRLLDFLPAIYRRSPGLEVLLAPFEAALFGSAGEGDHPPLGTADGAAQQPPASIEEQIARIPSFLDASEAPDEFLTWLAQWAAITLYDDARDRRRLVAEMIPLYEIRGTRKYVQRVLELYVDGAVTVEEEELPGLAVGISGRSRVGHDTRLGEEAFRFSVAVEFRGIPRDRQQRFALVALTRRVIDLAKPAYTHYRLLHNLFEEERGFVVGIRSTIGVDTFLVDRGVSSARARRTR